MNEIGWKSAGITPPRGPGVVVVVERVEVVEGVDVAAEVEGVDVELVEVVLLQAAAVSARAAKATPISPRGKTCLVIVFLARSCITASLVCDTECQPVRRPDVPSSCIKGTISCCERTRTLYPAKETGYDRALPAMHARRPRAAARSSAGCSGRVGGNAITHDSQPADLPSSPRRIRRSVLPIRARSYRFSHDLVKETVHIPMSVARDVLATSITTARSGAGKASTARREP